MAHNPSDDVMLPSDSTTSVAVQLALLTGKVDQVINDHERRLTTLENGRLGMGTKIAAMFSPIIAIAALIVLVADKIQWQ